MHHLTQQVPTQRVVLTPTPPRRRRTPRPHHRSVCRASSSSSSPDPQHAGTTRGSLGVLTKTGKLVPQGLLVRVAKTAWNFVWFVFMNELAPQSKDKGIMKEVVFWYEVIDHRREVAILLISKNEVSNSTRHKTRCYSAFNSYTFSSQLDKNFGQASSYCPSNQCKLEDV